MGNPAMPGRSPRADEAGRPGDDDRLRALDVAMTRHRHRPDALIEVLHVAQQLFGFLGEDLLRHVARGLRLPPSRVYGVATFYHLFTLAPRGAHTCTVCTGTACYVKGADALLAAVEEVTGARPGTTTPDGRLSLNTARCVGACWLAPIVVVDGTLAGNVTAEEVAERMEGWLGDGPR